MKRQFVVLFLFFSVGNAFGQANLKSIIKQTKIVSAPYDFQTKRVQQWFESEVRSPGLNDMDSALVISALHKSKQTVVNPAGGTGFGDLDWGDEWSSSSPLDNAGRIATLFAVSIPKSNYVLLHIEIKENCTLCLWRGILIILNTKGEMTAWLYSDGSANGGNPHGNIWREFSFSADGILKITEAAWGDNTRSYDFKAYYRIVGGKFVLQKRKLIEDKEHSVSAQ